MLGRLDDIMDDNEKSYNTVVNSSLPTQMSGEPVSGITAQQSKILMEKSTTSNNSNNNSSNSNNSDGKSNEIIQLTFNEYPGARPNLSTADPRLPLSLVVSDLVNQWSLGFLDLAKSGDPSAMCLVAQMYFIPRGYGLIKQDKTVAIEWLLKAVDLNDVEARELARKLCPNELKAHLEKRGLNDKKMQKEEQEANHHYK